MLPDALVVHDRRPAPGPNGGGDPAEFVPWAEPARPTNGQAGPFAPSPEPAIGEPVTWRTLADVSDDPPGPLLFGMLEPAGPTLAYGAPGVGKGTTGAWIIGEAQRGGMLPAVLGGARR
jgi:hypothetical protein